MRRLFLFLIVITTLILSIFLGCNTTSKENSVKENVYQRVLKTGIIRASYIPYPPYCIIDPNTGKKSGIFVDVLEEIGRKLELKINWTEEVGFGTVFEGLNNNRYDIHGSGLWENASRGKAGYFSIPLFFNPIKVWARTTDNRFDNNLKAINNPSIKIAAQDGAMEDLIAKSDFPQAKKVSITQTNPWSDNLLNIKTKKADITFAEPGVIYPFLKENPNSLKEVKTDRPIRYFANSYVFKMGENELKAMIDAALQEIIYEGKMDEILKKYETAPGEHLRVAMPFEKK